MTTNNNLCAPESIHTLSAMAEVLTNYNDDYPIDWVEAVCAQNGWQLCEGSRWNDEDICTDGREYVYFSEDRDGNCVCEVSNSMPPHTFEVFYADDVTEDIRLETFYDLESAKQYAAEYANSHMIVDDEHQCSEHIFNSSKVAQCRVYTDGIQMIGEDMNAEMVEPAYTTAYFYAD